jgi:hypothetical protein
VDTPLYRHAGNHTGHPVAPPTPLHSPERVARVVARLLTRPRAEVHVGLISQLLHLPHRRWRRTGVAPVTSGNLFEESTDEARLTGGWHGQARTVLRTSTAVGLTAATVAVLARRQRGRHGRS